MIEIYLLLLLVGLSMIFYVVIKNIKERKKVEEIQEIKDKEEILEHKLIGKFEVYKDKEDKYRFRLKAANGEIIAAASQGYSTKQSCLKGIKSVKKNAQELEVRD
jgi:uncharacterized protein YegP (UPF0339 family)